MLVSHDRALLRSVCDEFWLVGRGGVAPFDGDLDDYQRYLLDEAKRMREAARPASTLSKGRRNRRDGVQAPRRRTTGPRASKRRANASRAPTKPPAAARTARIRRAPRGGTLKRPGWNSDWPSRCRQQTSPMPAGG